MRPLIDGDVLRYEIGFAAETGWQGENIPPFDYVAELLDSRIANICAIVGATSEPIIYLTGKTNFRNDIAKKQKYKERPSIKPWHYQNLSAYLLGQYNCIVSEGMEADDLMSIEQTKSNEDHSIPEKAPLQARTIICTRDKDLRQVEGWHYGWELGAQPQFGPELVGTVGYIRLNARRDSIKGCGYLFFLAQLLIGDRVDTVPGLPGCGAVKAFKILDGCVGIDDGIRRVIEAYRAFYGDDWEKELLEQGQLLWMTRKLEENGDPVLWQIPKVEMADNGQKQDLIVS